MLHMKRTIEDISGGEEKEGVQSQKKQRQTSPDAEDSIDDDSRMEGQQQEQPPHEQPPHEQPQPLEQQ